MGGALTILSYIFIKETLYVPNAKKLPPPANIKERLQRLKFNPVSLNKTKNTYLRKTHNIFSYNFFLF